MTAKPRYLNSVPVDVERVCRTCGRRAGWLTFRVYKNGVRYATWYHCTFHLPRSTRPNFIVASASAATVEG